MEVATASTQNVTSFRPRSGTNASVVEGKIEFTFRDIHDLCQFVAKEISMSKMKHSKFAQKADLCHGTVSRMANGTTQHPRAETVFAMLRVLGYEVVVRA